MSAVPGADGRHGGPPGPGRCAAPRAERRPVYDAASLLAVSVAEFNARGYDATSMEDLSRAAGITKSSFYHHVRGKEELLRAALARALDGLFGILEEPARAQRPPALARLQHIIGRQVEVLTSELPYVTLLLRVRGNTETERWALARRRAFDASIAALVAEAVADGEVSAEIEPGSRRGCCPARSTRSSSGTGPAARAPTSCPPRSSGWCAKASCPRGLSAAWLARGRAPWAIIRRTNIRLWRSR